MDVDNMDARFYVYESDQPIDDTLAITQLESIFFVACEIVFHDDDVTDTIKSGNIPRILDDIPKRPPNHFVVIELHYSFFMLYNGETWLESYEEFYGQGEEHDHTD